MERGPLDELYQETILEHARYPRNTGELPRVDAEGEGKNPICGDEVAIQLAVEGGRVSAARFQGRGCALSQASASMLTEAVEGQPVASVPALIEAVEGLIRGESSDGPALGELECLQGVTRVPTRIRCALLSWKVLRQALADLRPS